jgi:predicted permease
VARLAPGVTVERAAAELDRAAAAIGRDYADANRYGMALEPIAASPLSPFGRDTWGRGAVLVAITCALVLLVACLNVANLLAARGTARQEELAVRQALGASRGRLARELITEAAVLAAIGGGLGTLVAHQALALLGRVVPGQALAVRLDGRALLAALALAALTALLVSVLPALESRWSLSSGLRRSGVRRTSRVRRALVAVQVAVSLVLLVGAGLLARTLLNLDRVPLGFAPQPLLTANLGIDSGLSRDEGTARWRAALQAAAAAAGVESAALSSVLPGDDGADQLGAMVEGREGREQVSLPVQAVSTGYFATLGVPLAAGRAITDGEELAGAPVALVNESFVRLHWPDRPALGQRIELMGGPTLTVVGVARDSLVRTLRERSAPMAYIPWSLADPELPRELALLARIQGHPATAVEPVRRALIEAGARRVRHLVPLEHRLAASAAGERLASMLLGSISAMALVLTALGLYSLLAWSVGQRTRELGVRAALGAHGARLRRLVLAEALRMTAAGVVVGGVGAWAASRALGGLLYDVAPHDPSTLAAAGVVLLATAIAAAWWPAHRATRVDPMMALRE